jgi:hypothetical protein
MFTKKPQLVDLGGNGSVAAQATLSIRMSSPVTINYYGDSQIELQRVKQELTSILDENLNQDDLVTARSRIENLLLNWK